MRKLFIFVTLFSLAPLRSLATDEYAAQLRIIQKKIERQRASETSSGSGALSSTLLFRLMGRYYEVGDHWEVAAWVTPHPNMSPNSEERKSASGVQKGGIFRYEVVSVNKTAAPSVVIEVRQLTAHGMTPIDRRVDKISLTMDDKMVQSQKSYFLHGSSRPLRVAPSGMRSRVSELELFPLDVPELVSAIAETPLKLPELPAAVSELMGRLGVSPELKQATWFEQDDFFGRPIQALWERGKLWPSYFRTSNGVAVLLTRGNE
jgi:hypothetical protein